MYALLRNLEKFKNIIWVSYMIRFVKNLVMYQPVFILKLYTLYLGSITNAFFKHSTTDKSAFMIMEHYNLRWVWPVDRKCLLFLSTWSHLRYIWLSALTHLFLWLVIHTSVSRLITLWYLAILVCKNLTKVWNLIL
jgi:hypothetical protein